jgi:phenylacetaldehyde dehydrogenase
MATSSPAAGPLPEVARFIASAHRMFVGGEWTAARGGATFEVHDPASGAVVAHVPLASAEDVDDAVAAARAAQPVWAGLSPAQRATMLWNLGQRIEDETEVFAQIDSIDNGKPVWEARAVDVPLTAGIFRFYAGLVQTIAGSVLPVSLEGFHAYSRREPVGVVGAIVPWNFPLLMCGYKLGPALAAGNAVVIKPAEQTPLSALRLAALIEEVGFPPGVVNVVTGFGETTGAPLAAHPGIDKISFTGSSEVGRRIAAGAGDALKKTTLELGGKSPNIIFADADLDAAVEGAHGGVFFNQGQCCVAGSRLLVERTVVDEVLDRLRASATAIQLGRGLDPATQMGPLVSEEQLARVGGFVDRAVSDGVTLVAGGGAADVADAPGGWFFTPTVLTGASQAHEIVREEVFGPVVAVTAFDDEDEAIALANDTPYGLASGLWTTRLDRAHRVAAAIDAGTVWVNTYGMFDPVASYGGRHASGFGRELGVESLDPYLQTKTVWIAL